MLITFGYTRVFRVIVSRRSDVCRCVFKDQVHGLETANILNIV